MITPIHSNIRVLASTRAMLKVVFLLSLSTVLQGCQDRSMSDLRAFVENTFKDEKPKIKPLPEVVPYQNYQYTASDKQDPFNYDNINTGRAAAQGKNRPDAKRRREPLENYPLDALKMVGTMTKNNIPWVIVQTAEGNALRATVGNYMGQNDGKIKQIITDEQKIVLAELVLDHTGRWVNREVEITIDE